MKLSESGLKNVKKGRVAGFEHLGELTFTYRNPDNGMVWCEDFPVSNGPHTEYGRWIRFESVIWS